MSKEGCNMSPVKEMRVRDFMVSKPVVFTRDTELLDAVRILVDRRISGAPVVDERGNLVGVLTEDYMSSDVHAVNAEDSLLDLATKFVESGYRRFPVMEDNRVVGLVTRQDVLRAVIDSFGPRRPGERGSVA
jgi:CBS domain-containing protein